MIIGRPLLSILSWSLAYSSHALLGRSKTSRTCSQVSLIKIWIIWWKSCSVRSIFSFFLKSSSATYIRSLNAWLTLVIISAGSDLMLSLEKIVQIMHWLQLSSFYSASSVLEWAKWLMFLHIFFATLSWKLIFLKKSRKADLNVSRSSIRSLHNSKKPERVQMKRAVEVSLCSHSRSSIWHNHRSKLLIPCNFKQLGAKRSLQSLRW